MASHIFIVGLVCLAVSVHRSCATEFTIGDSKGWTVPTDNTEPHYNQWAEKKRFQIGDSLVFVYPAGKDSVFLVSQEDYVNCNVDKPLKKFDDGHTVFTFERSGPHYFVSGNHDNCLKNEKVLIVVLSDRTNTGPTKTSPPPPQTQTGSSPPAPAPSGEESPSPPSDDNNSAPTPVSESTPPPPPSSTSRAYAISALGGIGASLIALLLTL